MKTPAPTASSGPCTPRTWLILVAVRVASASIGKHRAPALDYRCRDCRRACNACTGTALQKTNRRPSTLVLILRGVAQGVSTARLARELGFDRMKRLELRHKLPNHARAGLDPAPLVDPVVEADECGYRCGGKRRPASLAACHFLERLLRWRSGLPGRVVIIRDNAPCHITPLVQSYASELDIELVPLSGYCPHLTPIQRLWDWLREEVTRGHCHASLAALQAACLAFVARINANVRVVVNRLGPRFDLDPEHEAKLLVLT